MCFDFPLFFVFRHKAPCLFLNITSTTLVNQAQWRTKVFPTGRWREVAKSKVRASHREVSCSSSNGNGNGKGKGNNKDRSRGDSKGRGGCGCGGGGGGNRGSSGGDVSCGVVYEFSPDAFQCFQRRRVALPPAIPPPPLPPLTPSASSPSGEESEEKEEVVEQKKVAAAAEVGAREEEEGEDGETRDLFVDHM